MTQICAWCKKAYGEKCGDCGETKLFVLSIPEARKFGIEVSPRLIGSQEATVYQCPNCGNTWKRGAEPETHGVCPECDRAGVLKDKANA